jgi:outer membrane protein
MLQRINIHLLSIVVLLLLICQTGGAGAGDTDGVIARGRTYSLPDLYQIALQSSEKIKISEEALFIAEQDRDRALSVLIPGVSFFGEHKDYSEKKTSQGALIQPRWEKSWGIRVGQSFTLNGRELVAFGIAEDTIEKNGYDLYAVKEEYLFQVASAYYDVLKAMRAVEISKANLERLEKHREAVSVRLRLEDVSKTALYRAEAELSQSRADLINATNNLRLSKVILARAAGLPSTIYNITGPGKKEMSFEGNLDELKKAGLENRSELKSLAIQKQIAEDMVSISRSAYWPTLAAEGMYVKMEQDPSSPYKDSLSLGVTLNFTLYDGGLRDAEVKQSLAQKRQAELAVENMSKQIAVETEQAYLELLTHQSVLKSLEDQLNFARENYNAVSKQFQYGLADSVDVMDANTLLVTSEKQLSESGYSFQLAMLKLKRAQGMFLKEILGNSDEMPQ